MRKSIHIDFLYILSIYLSSLANQGSPTKNTCTYMYPRGVLLLLCSSSFRHALLAPLLGFQGHQERGLTYFKYTWSLALADFTDAVFTHGQFQKSP